VHCVVTSPPYWGLRDYGVAGQIGLESSFADYVALIVDVFREVRRVLRGDGTLWLNLGDSYASGGNTRSGQGEVRNLSTAKFQGGTAHLLAQRRTTGITDGLKPKDLCGIPWRVAFALQADGWYLRQDIIWSKPNPMPESVRDRCTKAHEYLFLLSKSERYYFDQDAILEPCSLSTHARLSQDVQAQIGSERAHGGGKTNGNMKAVRRKAKSGTYSEDSARFDGNPHPSGGWPPRKLALAGSGIKNNDSMDVALAIMPDERNKRSVWTVATQPFSEAHFATFPPALVEPCIKAGCPAGGVVLDPFAGAGTTGLVADRLGRNAILIELNPEYAAMIERRIGADAGMFADIHREAAE
jgi:DNA modification methylase